MVSRHLSNNGGSSVGSKKSKSRQQTSCFQTLSPSSLIKFLVSLGMITIFADTYFIYNKAKHKHATGDSGVQAQNPASLLASSDSLLSKLRGSNEDSGIHDDNLPKKHSFNFAKDEELPKLQKQNNNFSNEDSPHGYGKEPILQLFKDAGIPLPLDEAIMQELPTWEQVTQLFGPHPIVGGLDTCEAFKENVPAVERMLGSAGMFNSGTNLVTHLLKENCQIPERVIKYGEKASREAHG